MAQRLSGAPAADVVDATRHLLAVQAQDPRGARLALRARTAGGHASDVDHALSDERSLIITWVNRGTLHLIAAEDEPLLHALSTPQLRSASERRLAQEGVSAADAERVNGIIRAIALIEGRAAGTWTMPGGHVELNLWREQDPSTAAALAHEASAVEEYLAAR